MTARIDETWPTMINTENIRWESVKTEGEQYLDKLQSQLKRVMSHAATSNESFAKHNNNNHPGPIHFLEESYSYTDTDNGNDLVPPIVDDEGLHLLYDQTPNCSIVITKDEIEHSTSDPRNPLDDVEADVDAICEGNSQDPENVLPTRTSTSTLTRPKIVRFRSRVRIGSGIRDISASSSACESASSSISVPLRESRPQDSRPALTGHPTASLTEMLTTDATNAWLNGLSAVRRAKRQRPSSGKTVVAANIGTRTTSTIPQKQNTDSSTPTPTERTALLARVYSYSEPTENDFDDELGRIQTAVRKTEVEVMFGKWPWRLFNLDWWWWRIEPIVCCCERFDDESDPDY